MDIVSSRDAHSRQLGRLILEIQKKHDITQATLAGGELSSTYIKALIKGKVAPSYLTLEMLERRLGVEPGTLAGAAKFSVQKSLARLDIAAQVEDLTYAFNNIRHLTRSSRGAEALQVLERIEREAQPYMHLLPSTACYQFPFLRARAYIQLLKPEVAIQLLQKALEIASSYEEPAAQVHNMLGAVYYGQQRQRLALKEHLAALNYVQNNPYRNLNFTLAVYENLANDYMVLGYLKQAVNVYRSALALVGHVETSASNAGKARLYWGLAEAYRKREKYTQAATAGLEARKIYQELGKKGEATAILLNLAEMKIENKHFLEAADLLEQARILLTEAPHFGLSSYLHLYLARIARLQAQLEIARDYATNGIIFADRLLAQGESAVGSHVEHATDTSMSTPTQNPIAPNDPWVPPTRVLVEVTLEAAMVEVASSCMEAGAILFERALRLAEITEMEDLRRQVARAYALALYDSGDYKKGTYYMRMSFDEE